MMIKPNIHIMLHDIQKHLVNIISFYSNMFIKNYHPPISKGFIKKKKKKHVQLLTHRNDNRSYLNL